MVCFLTAVPVVVKADVYQDITNQLIVFLTKLIAQLRAQIAQINSQIATQTSVNNPPIINDNCNSMYDQVFTEFKNSQKCTTDSECIIMTGFSLPCNVSSCAEVYNKNYDLTKLKSLSKTYLSSSCEQECPGGGCLDLAGKPLKCIKNKCTISTTQTN